MLGIILGAFGLIFFLAFVAFVIFVVILFIPEVCDAIVDVKKAFKRMKEEMKQ